MNDIVNKLKYILTNNLSQAFFHEQFANNINQKLWRTATGGTAVYKEFIKNRLSIYFDVIRKCQTLRVSQELKIEIDKCFHFRYILLQNQYHDNNKRPILVTKFINPFNSDSNGEKTLSNSDFLKFNGEKITDIKDATENFIKQENAIYHNYRIRSSEQNKNNRAIRGVIFMHTNEQLEKLQETINNHISRTENGASATYNYLKAIVDQHFQNHKDLIMSLIVLSTSKSTQGSSQIKILKPTLGLKLITKYSEKTKTLRK